jgi:Family of unknown function (DUF6111)
MLRVVLEPLVFFLAPFAAYALWLRLRGRTAPDLDAWSHTRLASLTLAGLVAAILGILALGLLGETRPGAYKPAHVEGGKLVPGKIE